jgi:hypothetical protein
MKKILITVVALFFVSSYLFSAQELQIKTTRKFTPSYMNVMSITLTNFDATNWVKMTHINDIYNTRQVYIWNIAGALADETNGSRVLSPNLPASNVNFRITFPSRNSTIISNKTGTSQKVKINIWIAR